MCEYVAIAKSSDSDSGKTSRLTALLRQEKNHSLLECFRGEGQLHGHGAEAHFEGAPNWSVVIAKLAGLTAPPASDADDATADRMCEYVAIAESADSDSGKTLRLTALLRQEKNHSLLECFRDEGQWHGHGAEAHFEGAPNWSVVIAELAGLTTPPATGGGGGGGGRRGGKRWRAGGWSGGGGGVRGRFGGRGGDRGGAFPRELIDEVQCLTAPPATDADDATADRMWEYIAISKSAESDSGKTSCLTALLLQEENHSLLECFRGEGQWHGHGAEAHFEGAPNWKVVIAKLAGLTTPPAGCGDQKVKPENNDGGVGDENITITVTQEGQSRTNLACKVHVLSSRTFFEWKRTNFLSSSCRAHRSYVQNQEKD
jgi:hypothetical protein